MSHISKALNFLFNYCCIVVNVTNFSKYLQGKINDHYDTNISLLLIKILTSILLIISLMFFVEPEKLRYPSFFALAVLILSIFSFWVINIDKYILLDNKPFVPLFNFSGLSNFIGN